MRPANKYSPYVDVIDKDVEWKIKEGRDTKVRRRAKTIVTPRDGEVESQLRRIEAMVHVADIPSEDPPEYSNYSEDLIAAAQQVYVRKVIPRFGFGVMPKVSPIANKRRSTWVPPFLEMETEKQFEFLVSILASDNSPDLRVLYKMLTTEISKLRLSEGESPEVTKHELVYYANILNLVARGVTSLKDSALLRESVYISIVLQEWYRFIDINEEARQTTTEASLKEGSSSSSQDAGEPDARRIRNGTGSIQANEQYFEFKLRDRHFLADGKSEGHGLHNLPFDEIHERYLYTPEYFPIKWGDMFLNYSTPMPRSLPAGLRGRKNRSSDVGGVLKYTQRWCSDKQLFAQKLMTHQGGAVLIDNSGSMSLSAADLLSIMKALPGAIIGVYSGKTQQHIDPHTGVPHQYDGQLKIVARHGKRVDDNDISTPGADNSVDGPALEWLARQEGPRYWVSDGGVTFVKNLNYVESDNIKTDAYAARRYFYAWITRHLIHNRILRIDDTDALINGVLKIK